MSPDKQIEQLGRQYHETTAEILQKLPPEAQTATLRMMFSSLLAIFLANRGSADTAAMLRPHGGIKSTRNQ